MAVVAQFLYVGAPGRIFSFFINYMTSQTPAIPRLVGWRRLASLRLVRESHQNGVLGFSNKGAANLASLGFLCFLVGRFTGSRDPEEVRRAQGARPVRR